MTMAPEACVDLARGRASCIDYFFAENIVGRALELVGPATRWAREQGGAWDKVGPGNVVWPLINIHLYILPVSYSLLVIPY